MRWDEKSGKFEGYNLPPQFQFITVALNAALQRQGAERLQKDEVDLILRTLLTPPEERGKSINVGSIPSLGIAPSYVSRRVSSFVFGIFVLNSVILNLGIKVLVLGL
jgi:hypothetical protein